MAQHLEADSIAVDTSSSDHSDSDYASGYDTDSTSLITAARNHTFENGRRYHGYKEMNKNKMDLHHHQMLLALDGELLTAPIKNPQRILDIGTGTGIWAIDAGDTYPEAEVIGVDLSPIQPRWVPPNVRFEVDDIEDAWTWPADFFDYIHVRAMQGSIRDWPRLLRQSLRCLRPGGYVEVQDHNKFFHSDDGSVPADCHMRQWVQLWESGAQKLGIPFLEALSIVRTELPKLGYVEVNEIEKKLPIGPWAKDRKLKELGLFCREHYLVGAISISLGMFTRVLGMRVEEVEKSMEEVEKDLNNRKFHSYQTMNCIVGRKPFKEE